MARNPKNTQPVQESLFPCNIQDWSLKDDIASMEAPIYSLTKQKNTEIRSYTRGDMSVRIIPTVCGCATVFDKDLLLYAASQIVEALNQGKSVERTVEISSADFLKNTGRGDGRKSFEDISEMLIRLVGTTIETNITTGDICQTEGFSLIESYKIISKKIRIVEDVHPKTGKPIQTEIPRILSFRVTLSEWFFNGILNMEVLTLNHDYFQIKKPIERRLYEIARKFCGRQPLWKINIDSLAEKVGISRPRYKFRDEIRGIIKADSLPDYRVALDTSANPDDVIFYTRDNRNLLKAIVDAGRTTWFERLEKHIA